MAEKLTKVAVAKLIAGDRQVTVTDTAAPGLQLRVRARTSTWVYRYQEAGRERRLVLGSGDDLPLDEARRLSRRAADARAMRVLPDEEWLWRERNPGAFTPTEARTTWTFREAVDAYLEDLAGFRKASTIADYRHCLTHVSLQMLRDTHVDDLTDVDISTELAAYQRRTGTGAAAGVSCCSSIGWRRRTTASGAASRTASGSTSRRVARHLLAPAGHLRRR